MQSSYFLFLFYGSLIIILIKLVNSYSSRYGIPTLLLSLIIGMLLGNGDGLINFDYNNPLLTLRISEIALCSIIFYGGFNTNLADVKEAIRPGILLSTIGVLVTTIVSATISYIVLDLPFISALLLGAIISSTDAATVFSIFKQKQIQFENKIDQILKVESSSNDPIAYLLVIVILTTHSSLSPNILSIVTLFFSNIIIAIITGIIGSKLIIFIIDNTKVEIDQIPISLLAVIILLYSINSILGGNIYLAVYISGLLFDQRKWDNKSTNKIFFESLSWLLEIVLFFLLGLQVYLQQLYSNLLNGLIVAFALLFVARPIAIFISLGFEMKITINEKIFLSWAGLRGAAPIVFALLPLVYNYPDAILLFNITFLVVILSLIIHNLSLTAVARFSNVIVG